MDDPLTIKLSLSDAAVILFAIRALLVQLRPQGSLSLETAIKHYERQLPVDLSRMADGPVEKFAASRGMATDSGV